MMRKPGWRSALFDYIRIQRDEPYKLGVHDCWLFVSGAVMAMTERDIAAKHRNKYKTTRGALSILAKAGANNMAEFAGMYLRERENPATAQIGDVMAIPTNDAYGYALGILNGEKILVLSPAGVDVHERSNATRAFEV